MSRVGYRNGKEPRFVEEAIARKHIHNGLVTILYSSSVRGYVFPGHGKQAFTETQAKLMAEKLGRLVNAEAN